MHTSATVKCVFGIIIAAWIAGCSTERGSNSVVTGQQQSAIDGTGVFLDSTDTSSPISTVALVSAPPVAGTCSGTFVQRNRVLTATHCVCQPFSNSLGGGGTIVAPETVHVSLPQNGGTFKTTAVQILVQPDAKAACEVLGSADRAHDLAVLVLKESPPLETLAAPANVYIGPLQTAWDSGDIEFLDWIVGYGDPNTGQRAYGLPPDFWPVYDPCDVPGEFDCFNGTVWKALDDPSASAVPRPGDSGGPFFVTSMTAGTVVIGVDSGQVKTFSVPDVWNKIFYDIEATTATSGNAEFLVGALGADLDGDQVTDDTDNCPPSLCVLRNRPISECSNPGQEDADKDTVGDACDNCPPSVCDFLPTGMGLGCTNPSQKDFDHDGIGDTCDNCPDLKTGYQQQEIDSDGDGWGDACDSCPGQNPPPLCSADSQCTAAKSVCLTESGNGLHGNCQRV